jgi:hypothetical protein
MMASIFSSFQNDIVNTSNNIPELIFSTLHAPEFTESLR